MAVKNIENIELELFLDALYKVYGIDFKDYSKPSLLRRLEALTHAHKKENIAELIPLVLYEKSFYDKVVQELTVQYSMLFRDSLFFKELKEEVFSYLEVFPKINIWIAGCADGEEVYSMLILLKEANLLDKTTIYASDISKKALQNAKSGMLQKAIEVADINSYNDAGGAYSLSDYFVAGYGRFKLKDELLSHVVFKEHNLAHDEVFTKTQLVLCRNVMIYFNDELKERVFTLLDKSLVKEGYFGIGIDESFSFVSVENKYKQIRKDISIYKKRI